MKTIWTIARRELGAYFSSPVAYVFIVIFLLLTGFFTFMVGHFFERGSADLLTFFVWHPWLYLFLVPAVGMRLWSEELRLGTMELLFTMPVTTCQASGTDGISPGWKFCTKSGLTTGGGDGFTNSQTMAPTHTAAIAQMPPMISLRRAFLARVAIARRVSPPGPAGSGAGSVPSAAPPPRCG